MQRNCQQQWGGVTIRTWAALVGGFGRAKPKQQRCAQAPQQVLLRTPQHWGYRSSKIQWVTLIVLFFYIGESGNSSKTVGYEFYWVIYSVSTVFEERNSNTWRPSWKTEGFWFLKWDKSSCFRKDTGGCLGLLLFKSVWEHDTIWPWDVTGQKIWASVIH